MITTFTRLFLKAKNKVALLSVFFLLGCHMMPGAGKHVDDAQSPAINSQQALSAEENENTVEGTHSEKYDAESVKLRQCQSQLEALKVMNPQQYAQLRNSFDYLMNGAAQYANIRQKINSETQDTVDALYRYRANLLCSQIAQTLLDGLTRRGEARP